ncbi:MAG: hypothetical protein AAF383_21520, partial [Cyanobacteria bacterium P01_A01_bin.83]
NGSSRVLATLAPRSGAVPLLRKLLMGETPQSLWLKYGALRHRPLCGLECEAFVLATLACEAGCTALSRCGDFVKREMRNHRKDQQS